MGWGLLLGLQDFWALCVLGFLNPSTSIDPRETPIFLAEGLGGTPVGDWAREGKELGLTVREGHSARVKEGKDPVPSLKSDQ